MSIVGKIFSDWVYKEKLMIQVSINPNEKQQIISGTGQIDSWYKLANHYMVRWSELALIPCFCMPNR